jgi:toxin ParE1/3/4
MKRVVRPAIVDLDLAENALYIGRSDPEAGLRFFDAAEITIQELAAFPEIAGVWEADHPKLKGIRVWPIAGFENYLIFYRPIRDSVMLVRVLHGARDIEQVLTQE